MQAHRLFYPASIWACVAQLLRRITPSRLSTRSTFVTRLEHLLAGTLRVHHDHLEEVLEIHVEEFDQCLAQLWARSARTRLESRNIVLADAQVVRQFALRQTLFLAHRSQPGRPDRKSVV